MLSALNQIMLQKLCSLQCFQEHSPTIFAYKVRIVALSQVSDLQVLVQLCFLLFMVKSYNFALFKQVLAVLKHKVICASFNALNQSSICLQVF